MDERRIRELLKNLVTLGICHVIVSGILTAAVVAYIALTEFRISEIRRTATEAAREFEDQVDAFQSIDQAATPPPVPVLDRRQGELDNYYRSPLGGK